MPEKMEPVETIDQVQDLLLKSLEDAGDMQIGLSPDDSLYDLNYIRQKLALCGTFMARLSDLQMRLTKVNLGVIQMGGKKREQLRLRSAELKAGEAYQNQKREHKTAWLTNQLKADEEEAESWKDLLRQVSAVKEAIGERVATMRRLDSDLRLHQKLFEEGVAAGATSPTSYTGSDVDQVDL